ncbi:hypothetical protein DFH06DRAFT_1084936 [Mycena polygramma]|nr:hypothetical protein DFH06DRAFT_1084936 [Mycena polygramma]
MSVTLPADLAPYRAIRTDHEAKFASFLDFVQKSALANRVYTKHGHYLHFQTRLTVNAQLVTQINFGPLLSKQYFATAALAATGGSEPFVEVTEAQMVDMNLKKANAFKNFKSAAENRFYEMNLYLRDTTTKHHWRADIARPAAQIDLGM